MLTSLKYGLCCAGALFAMTAFSAPTPLLPEAMPASEPYLSMPEASIRALQPNNFITYEFQPNVPQVIANFFFFTLKASCTIETPDESNAVDVKLLSRQAIVNEKLLVATDPENNYLLLSVHNNDVLTITAFPGAKVELNNLGLSPIKANCTSL